MAALIGTIFEDAERLSHHLADQGFHPYQDFELLTVTLSDGALEIDPRDQLEKLRPHLESFGDALGYRVFPFDSERGTVSLRRCGGAIPFDELPLV